VLAFRFANQLEPSIAWFSRRLLAPPSAVFKKVLPLSSSDFSLMGLMDNLLLKLGIQENNRGAFGNKAISCAGGQIISTSPIDGQVLGAVEVTTSDAYNHVIAEAHETFLKWRAVPAPQRGLVVREIGEALRAKKQELGMLVTKEMGKISAEGLGEIQEAIDVADFAVGLSRQLYGLTMHSERPGHRMYEQWHPLGVVGVITAFNFPVAVWAWNALIAAVCGDVILWKPSEVTPLCAVAVHKICHEVAAKHGFPALFTLVNGGAKVGEMICQDPRVALVSATGSCRMGRSVGEAVAKRFGKTLLELGGNNAVIVMEDADLSLAVRSIVFGAVGTAGQRCTSVRRILVHEKVKAELIKKLLAAYAQVKIGDPLSDGTLMGPLVNQAAVDGYKHALEQIKAQGGKILCGGKLLSGMGSGLYVEPTLVESTHDMPIVKEEVFAPIAHVISVRSIEEAITFNNAVPQGLSSAVFTKGLQSAERFLSCAGSDCGIANVNIGTSGAEIGGAFGGEKETGGGRESGSDSWRQYMRRQTVTINYSDQLPLAQGIKFDI
jgi:aldehyde dehydrogenase (NAD+)